MPRKKPEFGQVPIDGKSLAIIPPGNYTVVMVDAYKVRIVEGEYKGRELYIGPTLQPKFRIALKQETWEADNVRFDYKDR